MLSERGLRAPSRKASGSWGCAVPAISGRRRRICNTSPRLPLSIWFAVWHGSMVFLALRLDALPLLAFMTWLRRVRQWSILKTATKNKRSPPGQSLSGCVFHSHQPCSPFASSGCGLWWWPNNLIAQTREALDQLALHLVTISLMEELLSFLLIVLSGFHHLVVNDENILSNGQCSAFAPSLFFETTIPFSQVGVASTHPYAPIGPMPPAHTDCLSYTCHSVACLHSPTGCATR
jgi:hypothetical protein